MTSTTARTGRSNKRSSLRAAPEQSSSLASWSDGSMGALVEACDEAARSLGFRYTASELVALAHFQRATPGVIAAYKLVAALARRR